MERETHFKSVLIQKDARGPGDAELLFSVYIGREEWIVRDSA